MSAVEDLLFHFPVRPCREGSERALRESDSKLNQTHLANRCWCVGAAFVVVGAVIVLHFGPCCGCRWLAPLAVAGLFLLSACVFVGGLGTSCHGAFSFLVLVLVLVLVLTLMLVLVLALVLSKSQAVVGRCEMAVQVWEEVWRVA